jgi:hypothetical protein
MVFRTPGTLCSAATDTARESRGSAIIAHLPVTFCLRHGAEFRLSFNEPWRSTRNFVRCPRPILLSYPMTTTDVRSFLLGPAIAPLEKRTQTQATHGTMEGAIVSLLSVGSDHRGQQFPCRPDMVRQLRGHCRSPWLPAAPWLSTNTSSECFEGAHPIVDCIFPSGGGAIHLQ